MLSKTDTHSDCNCLLLDNSGSVIKLGSPRDVFCLLRFFKPVELLCHAAPGRDQLRPKQTRRGLSIPACLSSDEQIGNLVLERRRVRAWSIKYGITCGAGKSSRIVTMGAALRLHCELVGLFRQHW